jgi:hypothetical protein
MPYINNMDFRAASNSRVNLRLKQVLVLASAILIGMLISVLASV